MKFLQLLQAGQNYEDKIINFMASRYDRLFVLDRPSGNFKYYDFILSNGLKYECKYDRMSKKTGNIFIEYQQTGQPSGIITTTADIYVIGTEEQTLFITVDALKNMILKKEFLKTYESKEKCGYVFNVASIERFSFASVCLTDL